MTVKVLKHFDQILTLEAAYQKDGRNLKPDDLGIINDASVVIENERFVWVGKSNELPKQYQDLPAKSFRGLCLTPEIVDSHTHLVFAGNRSEEYQQKINGVDYEEIAKQGGGILASMKGIHQSNPQQPFLSARRKIENMAKKGVGFIEIKSGYGLTFESEQMISEVIDELKKMAMKDYDIRIFNTFLAAHAIPKEFESSHQYLQEVVCPLLDFLVPKKIVDAVDIFQERGYFDRQDVITLFNKAKSFEIPVKIHADEFQDNGGAQLGVDFNALSADHLMKTSDQGIEALAASDTVATLLPGTSLFLGKPLAPAQKFLDAGCKVAMASDYNPGSCHCNDLLMIASIAAPLYKMNINIVKILLER